MSYLDPNDPRRPVSVPSKLGVCKMCGFKGIVRKSLCTDCSSRKMAKRIPICAQVMGCLCAGHARGNSASLPCDTRETV